MVLISEIVGVILKIIKFFFGTDKPSITEVKHEIPEKPISVPSDDNVLRELGLRVDSRAADQDGLYDGTSGPSGGSDGEQDGKDTGN